MNEKEKIILKIAIEHKDGLLSPAELINGIAKRDRRSVENLVSFGYLEEVPQDHSGINGGYYKINFYRATEKGHLVFDPWYKRFWRFFTNDFAKILSVIAIILSIIATIISLVKNNNF